MRSMPGETNVGYTQGQGQATSRIHGIIVLLTDH